MMLVSQSRRSGCFSGVPHCLSKSSGFLSQESAALCLIYFVDFFFFFFLICPCDKICLAEAEVIV